MTPITATPVPLSAPAISTQPLPTTATDQKVVRSSSLCVCDSAADRARSGFIDSAERSCHRLRAVAASAPFVYGRNENASASRGALVLSLTFQSFLCQASNSSPLADLFAKLKLTNYLHVFEEQEFVVDDLFLLKSEQLASLGPRLRLEAYIESQRKCVGVAFALRLIRSQHLCLCCPQLLWLPAVCQFSRCTAACL